LTGAWSSGHHVRATSTVDQVAGLEAQLKDLTTAGAVKVFQEQVSSIKVDDRTQLEAAIEYVRAGDVFVVTKIDRLARSLPHLLKVIDRLTGKGVSLRILSLNIDTASPTGNLMIAVMGGIAEFEREMMLERQVEGIAAAKAARQVRLSPADRGLAKSPPRAIRDSR